MQLKAFEGFGGVALAAEAWGNPDAPAVLLLPAGGQTRRSWRAAAQAIADAAERGSATLTISAPAKLLSLVHGIAPGLVADALSLVARVLPSFGGIGKAARQGFESHSSLAPSPLTMSTQRRAHTQNEEPV